MMRTHTRRRALALMACALLVFAMTPTGHGETEIVFMLPKDEDFYALDMHPLQDGRILLVGLEGAMNGRGALREDVRAVLHGWFDGATDISDVTPVAVLFCGEGEALWRAELPPAASGYAIRPYIVHVYDDGSALLATTGAGDGSAATHCLLLADGTIADIPEKAAFLLDSSGRWPISGGYFVNEEAPEEGAPPAPVYALFDSDGALLQRAHLEQALRGFWVHQAQEVDDGFWLAGGFWSGQADEWAIPAVVKLGRHLEVEWQWQDDTPGALNQLVTTADGGLISSGWRREDGVWMVRLNAQGAVDWREDYTGDGARYPYALLPLDANALLLADGFGGQRLLCIAPETGAVLWARDVSMDYNGAWPSMKKGQDGSILLLAREADGQCILRVR